ncbi:uncharacterized protein F4812DRAFT_11957 [Daldinia caldariorum]|uniref:uncharacterized protein n=1 Tax=Daldinia caldariorum TaxID=326644 RepID=UPI0020075960|nr:uncharacterized protein F4812DRAFT_11957 [Daldinia caldariorum]KAI1472409.1 hypothetical protein F4812DRAFT_11957 [Daldinia caldariorum]
MYYVSVYVYVCVCVFFWKLNPFFSFPPLCKTQPDLGLTLFPFLLLCMCLGGMYVCIFLLFSSFLPPELNWVAEPPACCWRAEERKKPTRPLPPPPSSSKIRVCRS